MNKRIVFWQPVLTTHVSHTYLALAKTLGAKATAVVTKTEDSDRKEQGWKPVATEITTIQLPAKKWYRRILDLLDKDPETIHVFGSPFELGKLSIALGLSLITRKSVFLVSEPYSPIAAGYFNDIGRLDKIKKWARPKVYTIYGYAIKKYIKGIFSISPLASDQFKKIGISDSKIFPFGYFIPSNGDPIAIDSDHLKVAFVGALIERKGLLTALDAMREVGDLRITFDIFGPGEIGAFPPLPDNSRFRGPIPFGKTQITLVDYDLLVVPSLHDGWAVVVNEAVMAGCAVVATHETGASAMIDRWHCGSTFPARDSATLANLLRKYAEDRNMVTNARTASGMLAAQLTPERAASYMADCIRSTMTDNMPAPANPWYYA